MGNKDIYFVMTCGKYQDAAKYLKLCVKEHELLWLCRNYDAGKLYCIVFYTDRRRGITDYEQAERVIDRTALCIKIRRNSLSQKSLLKIK